MSAKSAIEWTDATWNPVTGCTKVSQGCKNCYAEREWPRLQHLPAYTGRAFTDVRCHPDRLGEPLRWRKPRKIFVCHNADLFHETVSDDFIFNVFQTMGTAFWHQYQILTKRPERMHDVLPHISARLQNEGRAPLGAAWKQIWIGVSVEDQATVDERIPLLLQTPAAVRWISAEPLLGPILLRVPFDGAHVNALRGAAPGIPRLDWIVCGGESGSKARTMRPNWVRSLRDQCQAAGVSFFFKQWGEWVPDSNQIGEAIWMTRLGKKTAGRLLDGREWNEYPASC